jgi:hypothetical protein
MVIGGTATTLCERRFKSHPIAQGVQGAGGLLELGICEGDSAKEKTTEVSGCIEAILNHRARSSPHAETPFPGSSDSEQVERIDQRDHAAAGVKGG